jgi:hypothetical protein
VFLQSLRRPFFFASCSRKEPSAEIISRYQADADLFCQAIVDCMKEEVIQKLHASPERRDMVLSRMTRDFCKKGQYQLIGQLSTDPSPGQPSGSLELYQNYHDCAAAVAGAKDCAKRREIHQTHSACMKIKSESQT